MTHTWRSLGAVLACIVLVAGLSGCQNNLSDEDVDKIVDRVAENPVPLHEDTINRMVDAMLSHPRYLEYLEDDDGLAEAMVDAFMANSQYQEFLETKPEEDCAGVILMAAVISGDYTLPPDSDVDRLCEWYLGQTQ